MVRNRTADGLAIIVRGGMRARRSDRMRVSDAMKELAMLGVQMCDLTKHERRMSSSANF